MLYLGNLGGLRPETILVGTGQSRLISALYRTEPPKLACKARRSQFDNKALFAKAYATRVSQEHDINRPNTCMQPAAYSKADTVADMSYRAARPTGR